MIRNEYWIDNHGDVYDINEHDTDHENFARNEAQRLYLEHFDLGESQEILDEVFLAFVPYIKKIITERGFKSLEEYNIKNNLVDLYSGASDLKFDTRRYAILTWGWMTLRQNNVEMKAITKTNLSILKKALISLDELQNIEYEEFDEIEISISSYTSRKSITFKIGDLEEMNQSKTEIDNLNDTLSKKARIEVDRMDRENMPKNYSRFGDSVEHKKRSFLNFLKERKE